MTSPYFITKKLLIKNCHNFQNTNIQYKIDITTGTPKILTLEDINKNILDLVKETNNFDLPVGPAGIFYMKKTLDNGKKLETVEKDVHSYLYEQLEKKLLGVSVEKYVFYTEQDMRITNPSARITEDAYSFIKEHVKELINRFLSYYKAYFTKPHFFVFVFTPETSKIFQKDIINDNIVDIFFDDTHTIGKKMNDSNIGLNIHKPNSFPQITPEQFVRNILNKDVYLVEDQMNNGKVILYTGSYMYDPMNDTEHAVLATTTPQPVPFITPTSTPTHTMDEIPFSLGTPISVPSHTLVSTPDILPVSLIDSINPSNPPTTPVEMETIPFSLFGGFFMKKYNKYNYKTSLLKKKLK